MPSLTLKGEFITLAQALKVTGLASSGGEAKSLIKDGAVEVNGVTETRAGCKLRAGDCFRMVADGPEWNIVPGD